ncbi:MAG: GNAT family N-acetyltransferase [Chloroflexi bacterium]|nr:GNAT family N-acetyltransferase [Chloroflexota bacterium]
MTYEVRPLTSEELAGALRDQALAVFAGALGLQRRHGRVTSFAGTIGRHTLYGGFRAFGAFDTDTRRLVGFSYGYTSVPGRWWRESIAAPLRADQRDYWLADAFEVAELHVLPSAQDLKLGSQLHDLLVLDLPHKTALLSVMHRSERARQLYQRRGWQMLVEDLRFPTEPGTPFSLLGLDLR